MKMDNTSRTEALQEICQLTDVNPRALSELSAICRMRSYETGQTVLCDGETTDFIGCVKSGFLRMQKNLADGRQHILGLLVEGDMFGRVFDGPQHFSIEAATDAEICTFPRAPFEDILAHSPDLERIVLVNILNELDRARDWMIVLSSQKVTARLAGFLLVICSRFAGVNHLLQPGARGLEVRIPISRADLAHLLATRPETLSRAFHALADAGHIGILKPDLVSIRDFGALAEEAGDQELAENPSLKELLQFMKWKP